MFITPQYLKVLLFILYLPILYGGRHTISNAIKKDNRIKQFCDFSENHIFFPLQVILAQILLSWKFKK